jgi:hypothetical protein
VILRAAFLGQRLLVVLSYWALRLAFIGRRRTPISWVVGPRETAGVVHAMAARIPGSHSVALAVDPFYSHRYDTTWRPTGNRRNAARFVFLAPFVFAWLATRAQGFVYVGQSGFLLDQVDNRRFEFAFLKRRGVKVACYWCGSDIRSTKMMHELEDRMKLPNISTYLPFVAPGIATEHHEQRVKGRAAVADQFADIVFTFPTAQRSYLAKWTEPELYFVEDDRFATDESKFFRMSPIVVAHSASSPVIKGTQLVRAAVAGLRANGYEFEYIELIDVPNEEVLAGLARAHIALNHFYGFTVGMFGLEAMAARCAVISSTDGTIETSLAPGINDAVLVTKHYDVYDGLKRLLDNPELISPLAQAGYDWAFEYTSNANAGRVLTSLLDSVLDGSYDRAARAALPPADLWRVAAPGNAA